jgi:hypothetical protein
MAARSAGPMPGKKQIILHKARQALAALDFEPSLDCDVSTPLFSQRYADVLQNFVVTLKLPIATLGKAKTEIVELAHSLEDHQSDDSVQRLVVRIRRARGLCLNDCAGILETAEQRLLLTVFLLARMHDLTLSMPSLGRWPANFEATRPATRHQAPEKASWLRAQLRRFLIIPCRILSRLPTLTPTMS